MDLTDWTKDLQIYVNNALVKGVGRVDIIIEADKRLKIQILRLETKTLEKVVEEIIPTKAEFSNYGKGNMLMLKCSPFAKTIISRIKDEDN